MAKTEPGNPPLPKPESKLDIDYRAGAVPLWVKEVIETHLAIETEDAKSAGTLGYMARALVIATMPYKDPKADVFKRENGNFRLRILAGYEGGIPYGIYPRLLLSWVSTEAVRTQSPIIELGDSLSDFLRDVLDLSSSGGARGTSTRVIEQLKRLFGSLITAEYVGGMQERGFLLKNVLIADGIQIHEDDLTLKPSSTNGIDKPHDPAPLWTPQKQHEAGKWRSKVQLSNSFFNECIDRPVPIDLRAYKTLRGSPLAMDVYTWLTYRMSYTERRTRPIPWESLMGQFGSNYTTDRAVRDFRRAFEKALKAVQVVYPRANVQTEDRGLILNPSPPHIIKQTSLF
ncbi:RepA protein [Nitrosospira sp. Nsp5]|uniref:RepA protein n=1 Tax=Nitrosospira multiformis TaxID=1231 RepID=A0ABY0TMV7_9PROT|nr:MULTISPECIES: replication protein RepA [Nitrosospira]PTR05619.1 RepA protein [Nitrosospira sp. Nsp5]SDR11255.1 RepA protein [Nitrosospira multiformis]